jgi:hypothetical protein
LGCGQGFALSLRTQVEKDDHIVLLQGGAPYGLDAPAGLWERLRSAGTGGFERLFQTPKHNLIWPEIGPTVGTTSVIDDRGIESLKVINLE